jgi:hypothetical protein
MNTDLKMEHVRQLFDGKGFRNEGACEKGNDDTGSVTIFEEYK